MKGFLAIITIAIIGGLVYPLLQTSQWEWIGLNQGNEASEEVDPAELSTFERAFLDLRLKAGNLYGDLRTAVDSGYQSATRTFNDTMTKGSAVGRQTGGAAAGAAGSVGASVGASVGDALGGN